MITNLQSHQQLIGSGCKTLREKETIFRLYLFYFYSDNVITVSNSTDGKHFNYLS